MNDMKALCKTSSESEIKAYFEAVYKLRESREEFPVDLDEVWPLVYTAIEKAVRELIHNSQFIQNVHHQILAQNAENNTNDVKNFKTVRPNTIYKLSLSCMEFFIARKVRPVFEVYRQVFHGAVDSIRVEGPKKGMGELEREMLLS